uniref:Ig-like domain-containing protein n=1 Tax=Lates calcarifer TaxID=8187 RepID=A0A4W6CWH9_LATCA
MEMTDETVTCSSHNIYPIPQVTWATDPPTAQGALENQTTIKTADHKGLFTVESTLKILDNLSNHTYFCSFISADKTQVWTASWKNQGDITQEEGHALSISCIAPRGLQNFSLTWTFTSSSEPTVISRYDSRTRNAFNLWEGQAELNQDLLLLGDGSLLLHKPDSEEHSGTYTCTFSGLQSRHIVQTKVNITVASISVDEQSVQRSWWSSAASAAFVLLTIIVALPQCVRQRVETSTASHRCNGAGYVEDGLHKTSNTVASYIVTQNGVECNRLQLQFEAQDEQAGSSPKTTENCTVALPLDTKVEQEEKPEGPPAEGNDGLLSKNVERDGFGNTELCSHIP